MKDGRRIFVNLALAVGLLAPVALAQKPPAPTPTPTPSPPPSSPTGPGAPSTGAPSTSETIQPDDDYVLFLRGRVATNDGTSLPNDVLVERVCNGGVRQQVYASTSGDFNIQLGSPADSFVDASGDPAPQRSGFSNAPELGFSRRELANCELRASVAGFRSDSISLVDLTPYERSVDVGSIVVHRTTKIQGMTVSAIPYKAPPKAIKAYEKGLKDERNGKLADAGKYFEQAVQIYPDYASAWFQLGTVLEKEKQNDSARAAYTRATTIDTKFLPPYLSLASMAYEAKDWVAVLQFTGHILDVNPLNYASAADYVVDLDDWSPARAYFYNAVANYKLNNIEAAEKSARKAEHVAVRTNPPQLHLLLAEIFVRKKDYPAAISELQTYLELDPHSKEGDLVREQLAELEKRNGSAPASEKPVQN